MLISGPSFCLLVGKAYQLISRVYQLINWSFLRFPSELVMIKD
jgi:hypothetical protein